MPETHKDDPEIRPLHDPRDPPDGGATDDPDPVLIQTYPPPKGGDGEEEQEILAQ